ESVEVYRVPGPPRDYAPLPALSEAQYDDWTEAWDTRNYRGHQFAFGHDFREFLCGKAPPGTEFNYELVYSTPPLPRGAPYQPAAVLFGSSRTAHVITMCTCLGRLSPLGKAACRARHHFQTPPH